MFSQVEVDSRSRRRVSSGTPLFSASSRIPSASDKTFPSPTPPLKMSTCTFPSSKRFTTASTRRLIPGPASLPSCTAEPKTIAQVVSEFGFGGNSAFPENCERTKRILIGTAEIVSASTVANHPKRKERIERRENFIIPGEGGKCYSQARGAILATAARY